MNTLHAQSNISIKDSLIKFEKLSDKSKKATGYLILALNLQAINLFINFL